MKRLFVAMVFPCLLLPVSVQAQYRFPGADFAEQALVDSPTRDQLFLTWRPDGLPPGGWDLGLSADFLRNRENTGDWDTIVSLTGAYSPANRLTVGLTLPAIVRDPGFNYSGLLDARIFGRYRLTGEKSGPVRASAELQIGFPSGGETKTAGTHVYPFSLETTTARLGLSLAGGETPWEYGLNASFQGYAESESGNDSDLVYSVFLRRELGPEWQAILEYENATHSHTSDASPTTITSGVGILGITWKKTGWPRLGLAAGYGTADSPRDFQVTGNLVYSYGETPPSEAPAKKGIAGGSPGVSSSGEAPPPPRLPPGISFKGTKPGRGGVLAAVVNRSGAPGLGERMAAFLKKQGYIVVMVMDTGKDLWETSYLFSSSANFPQAGEMGRVVRGPGLTQSPRSPGEVDIMLVIGKDLAEWKP